MGALLFKFIKFEFICIASPLNYRRAFKMIVSCI
nr:MAG TPA: hypothetical protein [Caudoviricetes sp.]